MVESHIVLALVIVNTIATLGANYLIYIHLRGTQNMPGMPAANPDDGLQKRLDNLRAMLNAALTHLQSVKDWSEIRIRREAKNLADELARELS